MLARPDSGINCAKPNKVINSTRRTEQEREVASGKWRGRDDENGEVMAKEEGNSIGL